MQKSTVEDIQSYIRARINDEAKKELDNLIKHATKHYIKMVEQGRPPVNGGLITYRITPTDIAEIYVATCVCGKKVDLTDYSSI